MNANERQCLKPTTSKTYKNAESGAADRDVVHRPEAEDRRNRADQQDNRQGNIERQDVNSGRQQKMTTWAEL